ncbi:hypothetical protein RI367_001968 [Sorochytrium milnesiophthora]
MGKRKSARKVVVKRKPKLDTAFNCLYCNHEQAVEVRMDNEKKLGFLRCRICDERWQSKITTLSEPVDVYSDWLDAAEEAQKQADEGQSRPTRRGDEEDEEGYDSLGEEPAAPRRRQQQQQEYADEEEEEDFSGEDV